MEQPNQTTEKQTTQQSPQSFTYLCMSYPNYLIKRRKISEACKKANNQDGVRPPF